MTLKNWCRWRGQDKGLRDGRTDDPEGQAPPAGPTSTVALNPDFEKDSLAPAPLLSPSNMSSACDTAILSSVIPAAASNVEGDTGPNGSAIVVANVDAEEGTQLFITLSLPASAFNKPVPTSTRRIEFSFDRSKDSYKVINFRHFHYFSPFSPSNLCDWSSSFVGEYNRC